MVIYVVKMVHVYVSYVVFKRIYTLTSLHLGHIVVLQSGT